MKRYDHEAVERKWQERWEREGVFRAVDGDASRPKLYVLDMFPYPSAEGIHVGHPKGYISTDIIARFKRMSGWNVLHPMGFDAFGLPAENYAIKTGVHPAATTRRNIENITRQIRMLGLAYDWERQVVTTDPAYYRWTQWIFLRLFERGLAYETRAPINFCTRCKTGLANEEVKAGLCVRCGSEVVRKDLRQWALRITAYAERLLEGLGGLDWPESIKTMQREWIGRSAGADVLFPVIDPPPGADPAIRVFTTRPDTLYGATYMVLAPEHPLTALLATPGRRAAVERYVDEARRKSELLRTELQKEKTGVFTGAYCRNPLSGARIPVWVADYVLLGYGTGAIMAVPAHDQRDYEFARTFGLEIVQVVAPPGGAPLPEGVAYAGDGVAVNSGPFDGMTTAAFKEAVGRHLEEKGVGKAQVRYRLRDWLFSRQRYWGEPIPLVHCGGGCGIVPLRDEDLPLLLPEVERYEPTTTGESPLAAIEGWARTTCPRCGGEARRETNTMPQWAGSCWYYLRYLDPRGERALVDPDRERYWMPVDLYVGGAEHAVLHLLYARFWHLFLHDVGAVSTPEPFARLRNQGMILGMSYRYFLDGGDTPLPRAAVRPEGEAGRMVRADTGEPVREAWAAPADVVKAGGEWRHAAIEGLALEEVVEKMSKSRGNVITPETVVREQGADVLRLYEMFMGPMDASCPWSTEGIEGIQRFHTRAWRTLAQASAGGAGGGGAGLERLRHQTIRKVTQDIERFSFNTAISQLMVYLGELARQEAVHPEDARAFILLLSPFAPHLAEELWSETGGEGLAAAARWPTWDEEKTKEKMASWGVQVNGKLRGGMELPAGTEEAEVREAALRLPNVARHVEGKTVRKVIVIRDVINIVAS